MFLDSSVTENILGSAGILLTDVNRVINNAIDQFIAPSEQVQSNALIIRAKSRIFFLYEGRLHRTMLLKNTPL